MIIAFFVMAIQLFVSLIEFKLTTLAGFVLVPFGLFGRTAFLAEKVLGNVVSSGIKVLVLAVILGIGSTIFGAFMTGLGNPPTISDALTLILAAMTLLGLTIFGPGVANGLIAGGPQFGAAPRSARAWRSPAWARRGWASPPEQPAPWARPAARSPGPCAAAPPSPGRRARPPGRAPAPAKRRAPRPARYGPRPGRGFRRRRGFCRLRRPGSRSRPAGLGPRPKRNQTISHGASAAGHAIRSGDHPASGGGVDLSEDK